MKKGNLVGKIKSSVIQLAAATTLAAVGVYASYESADSLVNQDLKTAGEFALASFGLFGSASYNFVLRTKLQKQYQKLSDFLGKYEWDDSYMESMESSWCQRNAAVAAADTNNLGQKAREFYKERDHKWFHFHK